MFIILKTIFFVKVLRFQILICRRGRMRKGSALDPPKNFLRKVLRNLKNFQKGLFFTNLVLLNDEFHHFLL